MPNPDSRPPLADRVQAVNPAARPSELARVECFYFDAGGGHRAALEALQATWAERQGAGFELQPVQLQHLLDRIDPAARLLKIHVQDIYNGLLRRGWTWGSGGLLRLLHGLIRVTYPLQVRLLERHFRQSRPQLALSLVPNFNRAMGEALARACPGVPLVTLLTDLADYPPHFWIEAPRRPGPDYVICGSERAAAQARALGHPDANIVRTSGMVLHPRFRAAAAAAPDFGERARARQQLGLAPDVTTALVLFGGMASPEIETVVRGLQHLRSPLQLIVVCGRNTVLEQRLLSSPTRLRMHVVGFTREIPRLMQLADLFIGKPGPGSISEALAMHLPVIVQAGGSTLPQERYNAEWLKTEKLGLVLTSWNEIAEAVETMLATPHWHTFQQSMESYRNHAADQVIDWLSARFPVEPAGG